MPLEYGVIAAGWGLVLAWLVGRRIVRNYRAWRHERQSLDNIRRRYR